MLGCESLGPWSVIFFLFSDGKQTFTESASTDLAGLAEVKKHAIEQVRELRGLLTDKTFANWAGWKIIVNA